MNEQMNKWMNELINNYSIIGFKCVSFCICNMHSILLYVSHVSWQNRYKNIVLSQIWSAWVNGLVHMWGDLQDC